MWSLLLDDITDHLSGIVKELYFSFLKGVLVKTESILLSSSLQHWLLMKNSTKSSNTSLSEDIPFYPVTGAWKLVLNVLHKIGACVHDESATD
jgi:hypothetical protein